MAEILEIKASPMFDESIANYEIHSHLPYVLLRMVIMMKYT